MSIRYKKYSDSKHALEKNGMYIGSCKKAEIEQFVILNEQMVLKTLHITPGAKQLVHELTANAFDNIARGGTTQIDVSFKDGRITVSNNGDSIPVCVHTELNRWIPDLVASEYRCGDNMGEDDRKGRSATAGTHGLGLSLVNTFSKSLILQCLSLIHI